MQVAGRAGRFGSRFPSGVVTATSAEDLAYLTAALQEPSDELDTAVIFPSLVQLELLHGQHPQVGGWMGACFRAARLAAAVLGCDSLRCPKQCIVLSTLATPLYCVRRTSCLPSCGGLLKRRRARWSTLTTGAPAGSQAALAPAQQCLHTYLLSPRIAWINRCTALTPGLQLCPL
jgi:hypothetical protein